ncbi:alpha/beta hydrolase [Nocardia sp. NPDC055053]
MPTPKSIVCGAVAALTLVTGGCMSIDQSPTGAGHSVVELVSQADAVPTPRVSWTPCAEQSLRRYECASVPVPLDYTRPDGPTIELAVVRQPASDPTRRIGTLFTAAGGPGGSGIDWAADGELFAGELSRQFDVITFDQRGVGRSAPVRCFPSSAAQSEFWSNIAIPPIDDRQQDSAENASRQFAAGCAANSGELIPHLTTVDAARDLDLLRRAVGDAKLTYEGSSYASYLGIVYGSLFPDRVRALQLSSIVDPAAYTGDTRSHIADTALGTEEVLAEFLRLCAAAGPRHCAFAGSPESSAADLRARDTAVLDRSKVAPIQVGQGSESVSVTHSEIVQAHAMLLYSPARGWPALATVLTELELGTAGHPGVVREILTAVGLTGDFLDSFVAISCADNTFIRQPHRWPELARDSAERAPVYGPFWLYLRQPCAAWPAPETGYPQRFTGPWTQQSPVPALLINNRFDPATPLTSARRAAQAMGTARLVEITDGYGHEPTGECATTLRERYLIDLRIPEPDTTCTAGQPPFTE